MSNLDKMSSFGSSVHVDEEHKIKVTMIGDSSVGKSCLALRFSQDLFTDNHKATITDIETRVLNIEGQDVLFQIWDTAGQERFRSLLPLYLRGIDGAVLVYDLTKPESFMNIPSWISEVRKYAAGSPVMALVGNKMDLTDYKLVRSLDGEKLASEQGMFFMETSAKTGHNVNEAFLEVDISTRQINIDGEDAIFQIWDTAGQEKYRFLLPLYLRGVHGALLVYDVTKWDSFVNIESWINEVRKGVSGNPVMALIGNKSDLINYKCVTTQDGRNLASDYGMIFIETSAKTGHNVHKAFIEVGKEILKRNKEYSASMDFTDSLRVGSDNKLSRQRGCCS